MSSRQIAVYDNCHISVSTVNTHLLNIRRKVGLRSHWETISYASAYRESGLRREIDECATPYRWVANTNPTLQPHE